MGVGGETGNMSRSQVVGCIQCCKFYSKVFRLYSLDNGKLKALAVEMNEPVFDHTHVVFPTRLGAVHSEEIIACK